MAEELAEEEVWAAAETERRDASPSARRGKCLCNTSSSPSSAKRAPSSSPRMIPTRTAPVSIPGWSDACKRGGDGGNDDEEDEDAGGAPPHEWLAKKMARSQISSSSVCEGAGRTLKGRDLSKVRNAVLTKTGFLE